MGIVGTGAPRRFVASAAWALPLTALAVLMVPGVLLPVEQFPRNEHSKASLDIALNLRVCRRAALQSTMFAPGRYLTEHPDAMHLQPGDLVSRSGMTQDGYCSTLAQPITNNENSLMLMEAATWVLRPSASVASLGRVMTWLRVLGVALFGLACLDAGISVLLTALMMCGAMAVLQSIKALEYTVYPFLFTAPTVWVALCSLLHRPIRGGSTTRRIGLSFAAGLLAGFGTNLRSSYSSLFVVLFALVLTACLKVWKAEWGTARAWSGVGVAFVAFAVGLWAFNTAVMRPLEHPHGASTTNYTYHTLAHPLVMSLAVPENALSRSEHIEWNDMVGWDIAKRVQPDVTYLGPEYERALYRFYFGLWRTRPRDMIATYITKLQRTGRGVFLFASDLVPPWRPLRKVYLVWADRVNGSELLAAAVVVTVISGWMLWRATTTAALFAACLTAAMTLVLLESALIYSEFTPMYHSFLMFAVLMAPAVLLQVIWDRAQRLGT